jgi:hypothetical protein
MKASVAFCAPTTPPDTGASMKVSPCFSASSESSREPIGSIVLQSMLRAALSRLARWLRKCLLTISVFGSIVMTNSLSFRVALVLSLLNTPSAESCLTLSLFTSKPYTV